MSVGLLYFELDLDTTKFVKQQEALNKQIKNVAQNTNEALQLGYQNLGVKADAFYQLQANLAIKSYERITQAANQSAAEQIRAKQSMVAQINAINAEIAKSPSFASLGIRSSQQIIAERRAILESYQVAKEVAAGNARDLEAIEVAKTAKLKALSNEYNAVRIANNEKMLASTKATADAETAAQEKALAAQIAMGKAHSAALIENGQRIRSQGLMQMAAMKEDQDRNYNALGMRSAASINEQIANVQKAATAQQMIVGKGSEDWIRIERAKNDKLKALNKEMVGDHELSMAAMARAVLRAYAAYYVLSQIMQYLVVPFKKGFDAVETFNQSLASMAAMAQTFSQKAPGLSDEEHWKNSLGYATQMIPILEKIAAKTTLSGQETTALANAFMRSRVFLDANNAKQVEAFMRISNALPMMTQGQEIMRQINTEIRSVMEGSNTSTSMLYKALKSIDPLLEKHLEIWRAENTVMEHMGELLKGFGDASKLIEATWQTVKTTLDTTVNQILRRTMKPAYEEIIRLAKELNAELEKGNKSWLDVVGRVFADRIKAAEEAIKHSVLLGRVLMSSPYGSKKENPFGSFSEDEDWFGKAPKGIVTESEDKIKEREAAEKKITEAVRKNVHEREAIGRDTYEKDIIRINQEVEKYKEEGVSKVLIAKYVSGEMAIVEAKRNEGIKKATEKNADELAKSWEKYYDNKDKQRKDDAKAEADYLAEKTKADLKYDEQQAKNYLSFMNWRDKMAKEAAEGINKFPKEEIDAAQKAADEMAKQAQLYKDLGGLEDEYRAKKLKWIELEAAARSLSIGKQFDQEKWMAEQRLRWAREEMESVGTKFDYDNKYTKDTITNIGKVLDAAQTMYDKDSDEYKRLAEWKKGVQIAELAMEAAKNATIIAGLFAKSTATVAAATVQNAANTSTAVTGAVSSVAAQGSVPYVGFAMAAAMLAFMASVLGMAGIAFGGGSSASAPSGPVYGQRTTVLGGANDQGSESIQKSWELLEDTYDMQDTKLSGIYNEMKDLNDNITGLVNSVVRMGMTGQFTASADTYESYTPAGELALNKLSSILDGADRLLGGYIGDIAVKIQKFMWGGATTKQSGAGIAADAGKIQEIIGNRGASIQPYTWKNWITESSGGVFGGLLGNNGSSSLAGENVLMDSDPEMAGAAALIRKTYTNLSNLLVFYATELGGNMTDVYSYVFGNLAVNLIGLTAEEQGKAINAEFSKMSDIAVNALLGSLLIPYQKTNEGLLETANRLYVEKEIILRALDMTGVAFQGIEKIVTKTRKAITQEWKDWEAAMKVGTTSGYYTGGEYGSWVPEITPDLKEPIKEFDELYTVIETVAMQGVALSQSLIEIAGGLDKLQEAADTYYDKFFSEKEKQDRTKDTLTEILGKMKEPLPELRAGYRALVEAQKLSTEAGKENYVTLLKAAGMADEYYSALEDATGSNEDYIQSLKDISETIDAWLDNLRLSDLAPATSIEEWNRQYAEAKSKASGSMSTEKDVSDYLSFATKYLDFQKRYGDAGSYKDIYDAVVLNVTGLKTVKDRALEIAEDQLAVQNKIEENTRIVPVNTPGEIAGIYQLYFGRNPETAGQAYWESTGLTGASLVAAILGSASGSDLLAYQGRGFASGGYANAPSIFGESGPEWAVPAYEPKRSSFLKKAPQAFWDNLGLNGGSSGPGGEVIVHAHFHIDGKEIGDVVTKQISRNGNLSEAIRRTVN